MTEEIVAVLDPKEEAARYVAKMKDEWWNSMQSKRSMIARLDKRYHNYRDDLNIGDDTAQAEPRSNIGVPLAAQTVDTATARVHDSMLGRLPYGRVVGRETMDAQKAEIVQQVIDFQQQTTGYANTAHRVFRDAIKYGLGVGKYHFKRETKRVPRPVEFMGIRVPGATRMEEVAVLQAPVLEHVHIQDIFFPLDAPSFDEASGIVHRIWTTKRALKRAKDGLGVPLYDPYAVSRIREEGGSKDDDATLATEYTTRKIGDGGLHKDGKLPLLEYTGTLPEDIAEALVETYYPGADPDADWIVAIIDGSTDWLRCEPSGYLTNRRMFLGAKVIDDPGYIWGISLIEFVERLGLTIDELYNIVMDNLNFNVNKMFYVNTLAGVDKADIVSSPGKVIEGTRPPRDAIQVIDVPDLSQSVFLLINGLLAHYKEYTGITSTVLGQTERGEQTATEIASIISHSATRLGQFERMLEDTFMRPSFELSTVLNQQFIDQEFVIRVFKDSQYVYPKVAPEDMQGAFDYIFEGATRAESQALRAGQIMQALQMDAVQPVPLFNRPVLAQELLHTWGWKDATRFMNPMFAEQFMAFQQMQMLRNMGETAKALTPEQQRSSSTGNKANQGKAAPGNAPQATDFRSALAGVQEVALPAMPKEG